MSSQPAHQRAWERRLPGALAGRPPRCRTRAVGSWLPVDQIQRCMLVDVLLVGFSMVAMYPQALHPSSCMKHSTCTKVLVVAEGGKTHPARCAPCR